MTETKRADVKKLQTRANLPKYFRFGAAAALCLTVLGIGYALYFNQGKTEFRLKPEHTQLASDVVAEVDNYERTETEGDIKKYFIKAAHAKTFSDNHQELTNVYAEIYDEQGDKFDKITAEKALYIPEENKNFTGYFTGSVNIETRDALKVKTEQITYTKANDTATIEDAVEFERENVRGKSIGAIVHIKEKRLELLKKVEIDSYAANPNDQLARSDIRSANLKANYAMFDQLNEKIELSDNVDINLTPNGDNAKLSQPTEIKANRATAAFTNKEIKQINLDGDVDVYQKPAANTQKWTHTKADKATAKINKELKSLELVDNVQIETTTDESKPTKINAGYALYEKDADKFTLKNNVNIVTIEDAKPTNIKSINAVYEQTNGKIYLNGDAEITQGDDFIKGDNLTAELFPSKKLKFADSKGSAYLKQTTPERITEISANELNVSFNDANNLQSANAVGSGTAILTPIQSKDTAKITMSAPNSINLTFKGAGLLDQMQTDGRTTIQLNAVNNSPDAANKRLTADAVKTFFQNDGKNLARAEAVGNAEMLIEPLKNSAANYQTTINAARFDCEFYPTGNNAKNCAAQTNTKTVRVPTVAAANHGTQTLTADKLNAAFNQQTQDIQQFEANGNTKFSELDRHGIAEQISFAASDEIVKLRGGEPTVWDSRARAKAREIDWDSRNETTNLRGNVSTTYYNQKSTGGATPFNAGSSPVFVTADNAEFRHAEETGLYTGNARAWQENNYVRSDKLFLQQKQGQLTADGTVQSVLYNAKHKENGKENNVPVYAAAQKLTYNRENRILKYEKEVDIRQGTDRITAGSANVFMDEKNDVSQTVAETNVVVTQPNRRAVGDYAQYTAADEVIVLRGSPAKIEDSENGSTQGAQVTVYTREKRFVGENKPSAAKTESGGRIRSVYKVKKQ